LGAEAPKPLLAIHPRLQANAFWLSPVYLLRSRIVIRAQEVNPFFPTNTQVKTEDRTKLENTTIQSVIASKPKARWALLKPKATYDVVIANAALRRAKDKLHGVRQSPPSKWETATSHCLRRVAPHSDTEECFLVVPPLCVPSGKGRNNLRLRLRLPRFAHNDRLNLKVLMFCPNFFLNLSEYP